MLDAEFLEQVQEVIAACTHPEIQKAVFSATLPANAEKVAMSMLRDPIRVVVGLKYVSSHNPHDRQYITYRYQGYATSSDRTVTHLCGRRPVQATHPPAVFIPAIQPSRTHLRFITTTRDFAGRRACDSWRRKRGLLTCRNDEEGARRCRVPNASWGELGDGKHRGDGSWDGLQGRSRSHQLRLPAERPKLRTPNR